MGWLDEYEGASGQQAPVESPEAGSSQPWLEQYEAERPTTLGEAAQQVSSRFGRGLVNVAGSAGESLGVLGAGVLKMEGEDEAAQALRAEAEGFAGSVRDIAARAMPEVERLRDSFLLSQTPEALGAGAGFLLPGGWLRAAGVPAWASTMGLGAAVQAASQYEDARMHGASEGDQWKAWLLGGLVGTSEALPLSRILERADKASGGTLKEALIHGLIEGGEEFLQESGSQLASNAIASHLLEYDEDRQALEGVLQNGAAGFVSGIFLSALGTAAAHSIPGQQETTASGTVAGSVATEGTEAEPGPSMSEVPGGSSAVGGGAVLPGVPEGSGPGAAEEADAGGAPAPLREDVRERGAPAPGGAEGSVPDVRGGAGVGVSPDAGGGSIAAGGGEGPGDVAQGVQKAAGDSVPVPAAPQGADARAAVEGAEEGARARGVYAHTEEPASNSSVQPGDRLGPVELTPIAELREFNPRKRVVEAKVAEIAQSMREGKPLPPVIAHREADGSLVIDDGSHRIAAAKALGFEDVPVRIVNDPESPESSDVAPEIPKKRTADVVAVMRDLVDEMGRTGTSTEDEEGLAIPTLLQQAERVLEQRKAHKVTPSALDETLSELVRMARIEPETQFGSSKEKAQSTYALALFKKARTMLDAFDEARENSEKRVPERRGERQKEAEPAPPAAKNERPKAAEAKAEPPAPLLEKLERDLAAATEKSERLSVARMALPPGSPRARVTTANARWARAAEGRERLIREIAALKERAPPETAKPLPETPPPKNLSPAAERTHRWGELPRPLMLDLGRATEIELANGKSLHAHYAVLDADELIPSHDARRGFAKNLAGDLNERDYGDPVEGRPFRDNVERIAATLKPSLLLTDTPTPTDGPPIVTTKGVVLGGNARSMAIQLAYKRDTEAADAYAVAVKRAIDRFGVAQGSNYAGRPVLVRVVAEGSEGAPGELSRILNESLTTAKGATTEAVSRGALITPQAATEIANALGGGTLRDALGDPGRAKTILRALVSSGAFSQGDLVELTDPTKGTPTAAGKQTIEDALLGAVIGDVRTLSETPASTRQTLLKSLPALVRIKVHFPAIAGTITNVARGMSTLAESKQPLADALDQQVLPGIDVGWKSDRLAVAIMRSLADEAPTKVAGHFAEAAERIEDYAGGQSSLFVGEDLAPAQRLAREFGQADAERLGLVEEDGDIEDEPSDGSQVAYPDEIPVDMQLGYPTDAVLGGGANVGAPIGGGLRGSLAPAKSAKGQVNQPEIIRALSKVVEAAGGKSPIRWGRLGARQALGVFKVGPEVIRVLKANDIATAAHEVGHALEKHLLGWAKKGPWRKPLVTREQQQELVALGRALYGSRKPAGGYKREGFAEFVRLHTMAPAEAARLAPKFSGWFEGEFLKDRPDVRAALGRVRELAETWRLQGSVARAAASMVEPTSLKERVRSARARLSLDSVIEAFVEVGRPVNELAREAERRMGRLLTPSEDPFMVFQALRSTHSARVKQMIESGMIDLAGNRVGPALEDIRPLVSGRYRDFLLYLWGKRSVALLTDPKGKREPGMSLADAEQVVKEKESPEFARAAQMVYDWSDGGLNYAAQASPDFAGVVQRIRDRDPGSYIPLQREFDELDAAWGEAKKGRGLGGAGGVTKKLRGSGRRIKNPFPALIANMERTVLAAHRRMVFDAVFRLSQVEGLGHMLEEVPVEQVPAASRTMAQMLEEIQRRVFQASGTLLKPTTASGDVLNFDDIPLDLAGETLTFFAPAQFPKGQDPVIPRWVNGQVHWYAVDHRLARTLAGMDVYRLPKVVDLFLGVPKRLFTLGTTGLRASFGLITNPARDFQTLWQNSRSSAWAPRLFMEWIKQVGTAGLHHASGGKYSSPYLDAFLNLGAEMAQPMGQDMNHTARAARRLFQGRLVRVVDPRNALDLVRQLLQFPETAARVAELRLLANEARWTPGTPMTLDQSLQLLLGARQATVDFAAAGWLARVANQAIPFFNAPIQGARASVRAARHSPGRWLFRGLQMTAATLALWWMNKDREWYRELSARARALYWAFPFQWNGREELALIPRAQEGPQFFASMPEAMADAWYRQDPKGAREFFGTLFDTLAPNVLPVAAEEGAQQLANRDFFWETPIVPQGELRRAPEEQAGEYTSAAAKFLGELFGVSPRRIDHAIRGAFGGVASDVVDVVGLGGTAQRSGGELSDATVLGRLFQRGGPLGLRPRSIDELYDELERADQIQASVRVEETPDERERRLMLQDATQAVSALSYVRSQTTDIDQRRELTRKMVELAAEALKDARAGGRAQRGPMQQERKAAERAEKELKNR